MQENTVNFSDEQTRINQLNSRIASLLKIARDNTQPADEIQAATLELGEMLVNKTLAVVLREQRQVEKKKFNETEAELQQLKTKFEKISFFLSQLLESMDILVESDRENSLGLLKPMVEFFKGKPSDSAVYRELGKILFGSGQLANIKKIVSNSKALFEQGHFKKLIEAGAALKELKADIKVIGLENKLKTL